MAIMGVQKSATRRNSHTELLIDFVLRKVIERLQKDGYVSSCLSLNIHEDVSGDDFSDIFDHFIELQLKQPVGEFKNSVQLWAQTTCYKGNKTGNPEPNKTYEIRETLIEAIGLRRALREKNIPFRTLHFTIGPSNYTYGWFVAAKESAFDLSLYPSDLSANFFDELEKSLADATTDDECYQHFEADLNGSGSALVGNLISQLSDALFMWIINGMQKNTTADLQADLLQKIKEDQKTIAADTVSVSKAGGQGIKPTTLAVLRGEENDDSLLLDTISQMLDKNPFIHEAMNALQDWTGWVTKNIQVQSADLGTFVHDLWNTQGHSRLILRRLLLRIHTIESLSYVQDLDIEGITEHNLYAGTHTGAQTAKIVEMIQGACNRNGIISARDLYSLLSEKRGERLLRDSLKFESKNGTQVKPSFIYVENFLSQFFRVVPFGKTKLPAPIAYHSSFSTARVDKYQNLKVICRKDGSPLAIVKAKYFRHEEFPRRAKEESYVGLTIKYQFDQEAFVERYPSIPLIMFIDMDKDEIPPEYAIRRLVNCGWRVFFSLDSLKGYLDTLTGV